jgi:hypothetical protein
MTDFAMPAALELEGARRTGIPALRREVVHNTTTQNEYRPSELCYIPIDTGAAGAFTDVSTTRLEMTVVVRNKNYFIDFINLPRCGWHSLIQEFGIEINNGIHELNRHYAECVELEMIKIGQNRVPFEFTRSNPWRPANGNAGKMHINFIKPSMVTAQGLPHNVQYPSLSTLTSATTPDTITQSMLFMSNPFISESLGVVTSGYVETDDVYKQMNMRASKMGFFVSSSMDIAQAYYDDRLTSWQDSLASFTIGEASTTAAVTVQRYTPSTNESVAGCTAQAMPDDNGWSCNNISETYRVSGLPHGGSILASYSKHLNKDFANDIYNCSWGESVKSYPPSYWPAKQPCDYEKLQLSFNESYRTTNADSIMNYYANCKNIPVGIPLQLNGDPLSTSPATNVNGEAEIWGNSVHTAPSIEVPSVGAETEFHIVLKLYSSLIGELAKKWFPELVVPQGRMRVRIRFQEPQIVFQTLMDPCRRVPGTSRDWFPNLGITDSDNTRIDLISTLRPAIITSGVHPIMVSNYKPGDVYIDAIALGKYPLPTLRMKMLHDIYSSFDVGNAPIILTEAENLAKLGGGTSVVARFGFDNYMQLPVINTAAPGAGEPDRRGYTGQGFTASYFLKYATDTKAGLDVAHALSQYHFALKKNQEFGFPIYRRQDPAAFPYTGDVERYQHPPGTSDQLLNESMDYPKTIAHYYNYTHPDDWALRYYKMQIPTRDEALTTDASTVRKQVLAYSHWDGTVNLEPRMKTDPYYDQDYKSLNWNNLCFPTPQYLPLSNPSDKTNLRILQKENFVNENQTCFGTHRESSVAQVRRTHTQLYPLQIPDSVTSRIDERLTYIVKNVQIVTQQIVLPRTAALSIVENALNGGISMETRAWKEMESMLPRQETQKALINMAAAFCTDISFVFRPVDTFQGDRAFGYNSFSFYNPFTSFRFEFSPSLTPGATSERDYNYLGGRPIYYNECIIQQRTGFDIQLQLSSELLPRQPIDSIRRLIQHIRWGDQVFSDRDYMQLDPHLHPSYGSQKGMVINTLQDGFWGCYVPISALDDQTITCNPFFTPTELSLKKRIRGRRAPVNSLPIYKPFDATFHLSFNLEAFMGQNDRIRTGVPIVNNNMFLKMDKCHLLRDYDTQLLTICSCDARVVFERGGTMQFFT